MMAESQLEAVERTTGRQLREALLGVGIHLGWDQQTVVRISETVTGRVWQQCGADDVVRVARVLLEVAAALRSTSRMHAVYDGDVAANLDGRDVVGRRRT
jgi:UDP-3-O-acyl-N-acetylglucosamine deacetylase